MTERNRIPDRSAADVCKGRREMQHSSCDHSNRLDCPESRLRSLVLLCQFRWCCSCFRFRRGRTYSSCVHRRVRSELDTSVRVLCFPDLVPLQQKSSPSQDQKLKSSQVP